MRKIIAFSLVMALAFCFVGCNKVRVKTIDIDEGDTLMIAHRGLSGIEVENTDRAFIAAGKGSYYGIEADVRRTGDGKFVICHDDNLKRIAGEEILVEESSLEDLLNVVLLDKSGQKNSEVGSLATLESYFSICKEYDKAAILELKSSFTKEEIGEIVAVIESFDYLDKTTFISFNYDNLLYIREFIPEGSVMYLFSKLTDETVEKLIRDNIAVGIKHTALTKSALQKFHDAGLKVNCWTVDSELRAKQLISWGVDYITSNILE